jgi:hypothetical protein
LNSLPLIFAPAAVALLSIGVCRLTALLAAAAIGESTCITPLLSRCPGAAGSKEDREEHGAEVRSTARPTIPPF